MPNLADMTLEQWIGLVGVIVFGSALMYSIVTRQKPPGDKSK
jgi:hypothetical protein